MSFFLVALITVSIILVLFLIVKRYNKGKYFF
jgi:hypothetical protein